MTKKFLVSLCLFCSFAFAADIGLSPARLELSGQAGTVINETITVLTDATEEQQIQVEISDFTLTPQGDVSTLAAGSLEESAALWVQPEVTEFALAGGEGREFRISLNIPDDSTLQGTYHAMVFFTVTPKANNSSSGIGVITTTRIGLTIYVTINGTEDNASELVDFYQEDNESLTFAVTNLGNTVMRLGGTIELRDENGNPKYVLEVPDAPVLRDSEREVTIGLPEDIEAGFYVALALIKDSRSGLLVGELPIEVE
jgi:hypothetical protein